MAARLGPCVVFAAVLALSGCGDRETVRVHSESTAPTRTSSPIPAEQKKFRTLAAMVPVDGAPDDPRESSGWWFFKLSGPAATIAKYDSDFNKLIDTVQAHPNAQEPITWDLPAGWTREEKKGDIVYAVLKSPGGEVEIRVSKLSGSVLANAQRWWGQLWGSDKQQELTVAMLPEYVQKRTVKGRLVLVADMAGPKEPPKGGGPMFGPGMANPHGGMK